MSPDRRQFVCPLCGLDNTSFRGHAHRRMFYDCATCGLVFVDPHHLPDAVAERARYTAHRNHPDDAGYRAFLARLIDPLVPHLKPGAEGLDFGSGPGGVLSQLLTARGFVMADYDPFFAADATVLTRKYDFITCTEVVEHFHRPGLEFSTLDRLLKSTAWLAVMTETIPADGDFSRWAYARDITHVCFFSAASFAWLAQRYSWRLEMPHPHVALFQRG